MIRHSYNFWSDHFKKYGTHLTPYIVIAIILQYYISYLYFTTPWLFCNYQLVLLNLLPFFTLPRNPPPICQPSKCLLLQYYFNLIILQPFQLKILGHTSPFFCSDQHWPKVEGLCRVKWLPPLNNARRGAPGLTNLIRVVEGKKYLLEEGHSEVAGSSQLSFLNILLSWTSPYTGGNWNSLPTDSY